MDNTADLDAQLGSKIAAAIKKLNLPHGIEARFRRCNCGCRALLVDRSGPKLSRSEVRALLKVARRHEIAFSTDLSKGCPRCGAAVGMDIQRQIEYRGDVLIDENVRLAILNPKTLD